MCGSQKFRGCCRRFSDIPGPETLGNGNLFRLKLPTVGAQYFRAAGSPRCKCLAYSVGIISQRMSRFKIFPVEITKRTGRHMTNTLHEESLERKGLEILVGREETRNQIFSGKDTRNQNKSPRCLQDCTSNTQFQSTRNYGPYAADRSCYSVGLVWIICHAGSCRRDLGGH